MKTKNQGKTMIQVTYTTVRVGLSFRVGEYQTMKGAKIAAARHNQEMIKIGLPSGNFIYHFQEA
jgi:hypothetical protein